MERKDVYSEVGTNYRYFLSWRHKLLAGFLASFAGLAIGFSWAFTTNSQTQSLSWVVLLIGIFICIVFWTLDLRNKDLYHACQNVGENLETASGIVGNENLYGTLTSNKKSWFTHSGVISFMYISTIILLAVGIYYILHTFPMK